MGPPQGVRSTERRCRDKAILCSETTLERKLLGASETLTQIFVSTELSHSGVSVWVLNLGRYVCQGGGWPKGGGSFGSLQDRLNLSALLRHLLRVYWSSPVSARIWDCSVHLSVWIWLLQFTSFPKFILLTSSCCQVGFWPPENGISTLPIPTQTTQFSTEKKGDRVTTEKKALAFQRWINSKSQHPVLV